MIAVENSNNRFHESCDNGTHLFQYIDNTSKCRNCNITYAEYQEKKQGKILSNILV